MCGATEMAMDEAGMSSATASNQVVPGRRCGSCTLCCKVLAITELQKPRGTWCPDCSPGKGCNIYETRPAECRSFMCGWLTDPMLGPEWKPDSEFRAKREAMLKGAKP